VKSILGRLLEITGGDYELMGKKSSRINPTPPNFFKGLPKFLLLLLKRLKICIFLWWITKKELLSLGLVGMIDPPKEEFKEAIKMAKKVGIKVNYPYLRIIKRKPCKPINNFYL